MTKFKIGSDCFFSCFQEPVRLSYAQVAQHAKEKMERAAKEKEESVSPASSSTTTTTTSVSTSANTVVSRVSAQHSHADRGGMLEL